MGGYDVTTSELPADELLKMQAANDHQLPDNFLKLLHELSRTLTSIAGASQGIMAGDGPEPAAAAGSINAEARAALRMLEGYRTLLAQERLPMPEGRRPQARVPES